MSARFVWLFLILALLFGTSRCQGPETQEPTAQESAAEKAAEKTGDAGPLVDQVREQGGAEPLPDTAPPPEPNPPTERLLETTPDTPPTGAWPIDVQRATKVGTASKYLLGQYELSGEMFGMDKRAGMVDKMKQAGFSEWRLSVARWEVSTWVMPKLTDGTSCAMETMFFPPEAFAPNGATDFDLMKRRDWFTYTDGQAVTQAMTLDDSRYQLGYLRKGLDVAEAFGALPFVSLDHMPRALAAQKTPIRKSGGLYTDPCLKTFTNAISNGRPANPGIYAGAVVGLVRRIVEGSDGKPARKVTHWEIGNEPEFAEFWDRTYLLAQGLPESEVQKKALDSFFGMALNVLIGLDTYRSQSQHPNAKGLKFGLASFALHTTAIAAIDAFDTTKLPNGQYAPLDFLSFHAYDNDPMVIVEQIKQVAASRAKSSNYKQIELVLAEWGPKLDGKGWDATTMDLPLLMSTVIALGAQLGLDRAHHSIFWDFYSQNRIRFGLLDYDVKEKPLYYAYELLHEVIGPGRDIVSVGGASEGKIEAGMGVVLATKDAQGTIRLLLINRDTKAHIFALKVDGKESTPAEVKLFATPGQAPQPLANTSSLTLPPSSIAVVRMP